MSRRALVVACTVAVFCCAHVLSYTQPAQQDRVISLPGATSPLISNQFSGYLNVSSTRGIHYMYFESERDPEKDSVIFWTNGGPGCSGLLGLYTEFGPWRADKNLTLIRNPFSWTRYANIVFLEQPVGVGFSYSNTPIADTGYNDYMASKDNLLAVKSFFQRFPEREQNGYFLASESYGGHYIPQWTLQVLNDPAARVHFQGYLLGNPFTSFGAGGIAMANVLWGLQLVPKPLWDSFTALGCESLAHSAYDLVLQQPACFDIMDALFTYIDDLNPYALEFPTCQGVPSQHVSDSTTSTTLSATSTSADAEAGVGSTGGVAARLGAQGEMFMHMHRRLLRSDAYKKYKAGLHHTQQQRGKNGEPVTQEDAPAAVMPAESDINGVLRTPAALSAADLASFRRDVTAPATAAAHGGERPMPAAALGVRKHGALLSEESEFKYNPCTQAYTVGYLNDARVQEALHVRTIPEPQAQSLSASSPAEAANTATATAESAAGESSAGVTMTDPTTDAAVTLNTRGRRWNYCSNTVNGNWAYNDYLGDTTDLYRIIYNHPHKPKGFKMLVFSGDVDGVCATIGTQHWIYNVTGSPPVSLYIEWTYEDTQYQKQQGGYLTKFKDSFSFLTVRYAGHEVPAYQPQKALEVLRRYLDGTLFSAEA